MKFLIQIPQLIYGGAEKVLVNFANDLVQRGNEVEILETYERGFLKNQFDSRVTFHSICSKEFTEKYYVSFDKIKEEKNVVSFIKNVVKKMFITIVGYRRLAEKLCGKYYQEKAYDVVINYLEIESPEFLLNKIHAKKYIQWIHTDIEKAEDEMIVENSKYWRNVDKIICVSKYAKNKFVWRYPDLMEKTAYIYNWYNSENIIRKANKRIEDSRYKKNADRKTILSIGRLIDAKAYPRAIDIMYQLKSEGYQFKWFIMGMGILESEIKGKIAELGLENEVILLGVKENPYPYIRICDLFFLPSLYEGFPTVTIEAKVLEKPVLATRVSGIEEQIINHKTGIIVENSEEGIYQGLKEYLDNPQLLEEYADNSNISEIVGNDSKYNYMIEILRGEN